MSTAQAMRNLDNRLTDQLVDAIERDGNILQFTLPDHDADIEKLADIHRKGVADHSRKIAETKRSLRKAVASLNKEIKRLKTEIDEAKEGAARKIEAEQKIVKASNAFLAAVE